MELVFSIVANNIYEKLISLYPSYDDINECLKILPPENPLYKEYYMTKFINGIKTIKTLKYDKSIKHAKSKNLNNEDFSIEKKSGDYNYYRFTTPFERYNYWKKYVNVNKPDRDFIDKCDFTNKWKFFDLKYKNVSIQWIDKLLNRARKNNITGNSIKSDDFNSPIEYDDNSSIKSDNSDFDSPIEYDDNSSIKSGNSDFDSPIEDDNISPIKSSNSDFDFPIEDDNISPIKSSNSDFDYSVETYIEDSPPIKYKHIPNYYHIKDFYRETILDFKILLRERGYEDIHVGYIYYPKKIQINSYHDWCKEGCKNKFIIKLREIWNCSDTYCNGKETVYYRDKIKYYIDPIYERTCKRINLFEINNKINKIATNLYEVLYAGIINCGFEKFYNFLNNFKYNGDILFQAQRFNDKLLKNNECTLICVFNYMKFKYNLWSAKDIMLKYNNFDYDKNNYIVLNPFPKDFYMAYENFNPLKIKFNLM